MKKYFIVSDIHAHYALLINALGQAGFDINNPKHILVIGGDILDRGEEGKQVIRYLEELIVKDRLQGVLGNHDAFLIDILNRFYDQYRIAFNIDYNGFLKTLQIGEDYLDDFKIEPNYLDSIRDKIIKNNPIFCRWLLKLPLYLEFKHHVLVHAFLDFSLDDWHNTSKKIATWERGFKKDIPEEFNKKLIFGHTPNIHINNTNDIIYDGKKIMIDGGAAFNKQINVLVFDEREI